METEECFGCDYLERYSAMRAGLFSFRYDYYYWCDACGSKVLTPEERPVWCPMDRKV